MSTSSNRSRGGRRGADLLESETVASPDTNGPKRRKPAPSRTRATTKDFHLLVDGHRVEPMVRDHVAAFIVPAAPHDVRIVSPTWSPRDKDPACRDERQLGVLIESIVVDDLLGVVTTVPLDSPDIVAGFHPVESSSAGTWRWTDGEALLSETLFAAQGPSVLRLQGRFSAPSGG